MKICISYSYLLLIGIIVFFIIFPLTLTRRIMTTRTSTWHGFSSTTTATTFATLATLFTEIWLSGFVCCIHLLLLHWLILDIIAYILIHKILILSLLLSLLTFHISGQFWWWLIHDVLSFLILFLLLHLLALHVLGLVWMMSLNVFLLLGLLLFLIILDILHFSLFVQYIILFDL